VAYFLLLVALQSKTDSREQSSMWLAKSIGGTEMKTLDVKLALAFAVLSVLLGSNVWAAYTTVTCNHGETGTCRQANSCSSTDVASAISASAAGGYGTMTSGGLPRADGTFDGDGVYIPNCSSTSVGTLSWSNKNINLRGLNDCTLDVDGLPTSCPTNVSGGFQINITDAGGRKAAFKISHLAFTASGAFINYNNGNPHSSATAAGYFRVDHIKLSLGGGANSIQHYGVVYGLYDHLNITIGATMAPLLEQSEYLNSEYGVGPTVFLGEYSAKRKTPIGTIDNVFIEDSKFTLTSASGLNPLTDTEAGGGHLVFRHNTVTSAGSYFYFYGHWSGTSEWGGYWREFYNNKLVNTRGTENYPFRFEAGSGVIYNNQISGFDDVSVHVDEGRGCGGVTAGASYACDGTRAWDMNAGDSNAPGWPCMGQIGSGCLTTGGCTRGNMDNIPLILWNNGTQATCATGGACTNSLIVRVLDAPGNGGSCTKTTANYIKKTPHTASVGKYNGTVDYSDGNSSMPVTVGTYTNNYKPYNYPHPLQGGGGNDNETVTPPTNLRIAP
jgi:hypothetical protein